MEALFVLEGDIDEEDNSESTIITTKIKSFIVKRILVDNNTSHDILYVDTLSRMDLNWNRLASHADLVIYFVGGNTPL